MADVVDATPFVPAMPEEARAMVRRALDGEEPWAKWFRAPAAWSQVVTCVEWACRTPLLPVVELGWLCGIAMFVDPRDSIARTIVGSAARPLVPSAIDAFAAGISLGRVATASHWQSIAKLASMARAVPPSMIPAVVVGCASPEATIRGAAMSLARYVDRAEVRRVFDARSRGASRAVEKRLDAASMALGDGTTAGVNEEDVGLLVRLLDAWRATAADELVEFIATIGARIAMGRGALPMRSKVELEPAWHALAQQLDPADIDRLLSAPWPAVPKPAEQRVVALSKFPSDPRILARLAAVAPAYTGPGASPFHARVAKLLAVAPAPAGLVAIATIEAAAREQGEYRGARDEQIRPTGTRPPVDPALLEEARLRTVPDDDLAALWDAHVANPGDLAHRAVLADALQRAGDPRGEFIACQLAIDGGAAGAAVRARAAELLSIHGDAWAPLPRLDPERTKFARGFLVAASTRAPTKDLVASFENPAWATVEDLTIEDARCDLGPLLRRMPLLRRLAVKREDALASVRAADVPSLRAVACDSAWRPARFELPPLDVIAGRWPVGTAIGLPRVRAIVVLGATLEMIAPLASQRRIGPEETRACLDPSFHGFAGAGWCVRMWRERTDAVVAWAGGDQRAQLPLQTIVVTLLREGFTTVRVKPPQRPVGPVKAWLEQLVDDRVVIDNAAFNLGG